MLRKNGTEHLARTATMIERIVEVVIRANQNAIDEMPIVIEKRLIATDGMPSVIEKRLIGTDEMPIVVMAIAVMVAEIETSSSAEMTATERIATVIMIGDAIVTRMMADAIAIDEKVIDVEIEREAMMSEIDEIAASAEMLTVTAMTEIAAKMIAMAVEGESAS